VASWKKSERAPVGLNNQLSSSHLLTRTAYSLFPGARAYGTAGAHIIYNILGHASASGSLQSIVLHTAHYTVSTIDTQPWCLLVHAALRSRAGRRFLAFGSPIRPLHLAACTAVCGRR
jgi:hypothetical protein